MTIPIAISPCPNDTFLFYGWIFDQIDSSLKPKPHYADIQQLNEWALEGNFPLIKVSFGICKEILALYEILPTGAALGFNCGPKLIAKEPQTLQEVLSKRVAIPGKNTTAALLLDRLFGPVEKKIPCLYHEVFEFLDKDYADSGVIIHESRFTFAGKGFLEIADLGTLWTKKYSLPLPLGCLAIKRDLPLGQKKEILDSLQKSLHFSIKNPIISTHFVSQMAQEKESEIIKAHIALYVNDETVNLSENGIRGIETLLNLERSRWLCNLNDEKKISGLCSERGS